MIDGKFARFRCDSIFCPSQISNFTLPKYSSLFKRHKSYHTSHMFTVLISLHFTGNVCCSLGKSHKHGTLDRKRWCNLHDIRQRTFDKLTENDLFEIDWFKCLWNRQKRQEGVTSFWRLIYSVLTHLKPKQNILQQTHPEPNVNNGGRHQEQIDSKLKKKLSIQ